MCVCLPLYVWLRVSQCWGIRHPSAPWSNLPPRSRQPLLFPFSPSFLLHFFSFPKIQLGSLRSAVSSQGGLRWSLGCKRIFGSRNTSHGNSLNRSCAVQMTVFRWFVRWKESPPQFTSAPDFFREASCFHLCLEWTPVWLCVCFGAVCCVLYLWTSASSNYCQSSIIRTHWRSLCN